ncbi:MAG: hypothetical protein WAX07_05965 [Candidatus Altiarchaeia archaeon]
MYRGPENVDWSEDDDLVDGFFADAVNLQAGEKYSDRFAWAIPENTKPGVYVVSVYFPVKKKFNNAGVSFRSSVPAATTSVDIRTKGPVQDRRNRPCNCELAKGMSTVFIQARGNEDLWSGEGKNSCESDDLWVKKDVDFSARDTDTYLVIVYN